MKTIIFIDGENLRYSLNDMRLPGESYGLREGNIHWAKFFQKCLDPCDELIRAYWFQTEKLSTPMITVHKANKMIKMRGEFVGDRDAEVARTMREANMWYEEKERGHKNMLEYFDRLSERFSEIEMVRKGILKIDPFKKLYLGEKGLDVALAIGMVKRCEYCDKIILISGDLDYSEAIQYVKDKLRKVYLVRLFRGQPPANRSVSRQLLTLVDKIIDVHESEIRDGMLVG